MGIAGVVGLLGTAAGLTKNDTCLKCRRAHQCGRRQYVVAADVVFVLFSVFVAVIVVVTILAGCSVYIRPCLCSISSRSVSA